ncbi:hypothetical protein Dsin_016595 [Dipteronia sinensis]|uniref:Uncharacterized protein n=1 Tax=Dipteronia sinensis TaxID=43782 RepID=A0AAE0ADN1_9ROSI|nr:hypothetical protein Dsin_016595 [Dipteronia sinensis]
MGLLMCMAKLIPNDNERLQTNLQIDLFRNKKGLFSLGLEKALINNRSHTDWWIQFGDETLELTSFTIHTKKRNRLDTKKLNSLVYIMYNTRLKHIFLKKQALKDDEDPLVCEDVPSDDEWIVEQDAVGETSTNVDMSEPSGSQQVGEKRRRNTTEANASFASRLPPHIAFRVLKHCMCLAL